VAGPWRWAISGSISRPQSQVGLRRVIARRVKDAAPSSSPAWVGSPRAAFLLALSGGFPGESHITRSRRRPSAFNPSEGTPRHDTLSHWRPSPSRARIGRVSVVASVIGGTPLPFGQFLPALRGNPRGLLCDSRGARYEAYLTRWGSGANSGRPWAFGLNQPSATPLGIRRLLEREPSRLLQAPIREPPSCEHQGPKAPSPPQGPEGPKGAARCGPLRPRTRGVGSRPRASTDRLSTRFNLNLAESAATPLRERRAPLPPESGFRIAAAEPVEIKEI